MSYRSLVSYGKRQEYTVIAELLRHNFDVFVTLVDDQQMDCIIRQENGDELRYLDIQIRATEKGSESEYAGTFTALEVNRPRENYYFIFYSEKINTFWVIPSLHLILEANQVKEGIYKGKYTIDLCIVNERGLVSQPRFQQYENAFQLLEWKNLPAPISKPLDAKPFIQSLGVGAGSLGAGEGAEIQAWWHEIARLKGETLETLEQHKKFTIVDVTEKNVLVKIEATGLNRSISFKNEIYPACKALYAHREITIQEIQKFWAEFNTSFISSILANLPGVQYKTKPVIKLFLN